MITTGMTTTMTTTDMTTMTTSDAYTFIPAVCGGGLAAAGRAAAGPHRLSEPHHPEWLYMSLADAGVQSTRLRVAAW